MNYLKNLRLKRDLTQSQVADFLGISSQAYGYYEAGKRDMSLDTAKKLADFFNVPISFISGDSDFNSASVEELGVKVPVLGRISAGLPILAVENIDEYEFAPSNVMKPNHVYFFLQVHGDSMNLKFHDGDLVLIEQCPDIENGEIGAFLIDNESCTLKKFNRQNGLVILNPMSTNPIHQPQFYNPNETVVTCIGKVVAYLGIVKKEI